MISKPPASTDSGDEELAELVDELADRIQAGKPIDPEALVRAHPKYANRIEDLLPVLRAMAGLGKSSDYEPGSHTGMIGDFRILREVGRGGMGIVYEANQISLGRRVALKVLPFAGVFDPRQILRFQNEARAAACLHHPHIVPVYAVGCDRGVHYFAMQFIDGPSLATAIGHLRLEHQQTRLDGGTLAADDALPTTTDRTPALALLSTERAGRPANYVRVVVRLIIQAASALDYAHQQGIVHRDIKPANLLLDPNGDVWMTDFGLAHFRAECGVTQTGEVIGTLQYMSPEQTLGRRRVIDHRTDIYSLGISLYELLTLAPAFDGLDRQDVLQRIASEEPVSARRLNTAVPAELETIISKAIAKVPEERYATAQELADDLQRWLDDRPILAHPPGPLQRLRKWSRRRRPLVIAIAISLTVVTAGLVVGSVLYAARQKQLADDRERFAHEREQSEWRIARDLRKVLVGRAQAMQLARQPGYRSQVWADLREAAKLPLFDGEPDLLPAAVLGCLADPIGLEPIKDPGSVPRRKPQETPKWLRDAAANGAFAVSPHGNFFASAEARTVTLHGLDGIRAGTAVSPLGAVYDLTFSPSGMILLAGCEQGFVAWGFPYNDRWVVRGGNITSVSVSPDNHFLAVCGRQIELWSMDAKRPIVSLPSPAAGTRVEFSADGRILLAVLNQRVLAGWQVIDTPERKVLVHHTLGVPAVGHQRGVPAVAFRPDGKHVVSVSKDIHVRVWDTVTGRSLFPDIGHPASEIESVAFSPDGALFATGDFGGLVRIWDSAKGVPLADISSNSRAPGQVWRVRFGPTGEWLAAAGELGVAIWKLTRTSADRISWKPIRTITVPGERPGAVDLAIHPNGSEVVFLSAKGELYSCNWSRDDPPHRMAVSARGAVRSLEFDRSGDRLTFITATGMLGLWDWRAGRAVDTHHRAESVALSADGKWAVVAEAEQRVTILELASGHKVFTLPSEGADIWCLAWAGDGMHLAVGLSDGLVALWDLGQVRSRLNQFGIDCPSMSR